MPANSLDASFSIGAQSAKDTAATAYYTTLATVSGLNVAFDLRDPLLEHPGPTSARATSRKSASQRTGYLVPWTSTFLLRPRFIGMALRSMGFDVASTDNTTYDTHDFTIADVADMDWFSILHELPHTGTDPNRKAINCRGTRLALTADTSQVECTLEGTGLVEGNVLGTETKTAEITTEIVPTVGALTAEISAVSLVSQIRGATMEIAQTLREDELILFATGRIDLPRQNIDVSGTFTGIDIDFDTYKKLIRGGTSGTAPSLSPVTGNIEFEFRSSSNISGAAVPFEFTVTVPTVEFRFDENSFQANGDDSIRFDLQWFMIDDSADPITISLDNDQASYA